MKYYGKVNGAPALALHLDLDLLRVFISDLRAGRSVDSDVYTFLFTPGAVKPAMARLEADLERAFPRLGDIKYFFARHELGTKVSANERAYLEECWSSSKAQASQNGAADLSFELRWDLAAA